MVAGMIVGGGVGAFVVGPALAGPSAAGSHEETVEGGHGEAAPEFLSHLVEGLIVNPAGTGGTRLLLISVALVVDSEETATEAEDRDPEVRDALLGVLGRKTVDELTDTTRRDALKEELLAAVQGLGFGDRILRIHIPQFVVQ